MVEKIRNERNYKMPDKYSTLNYFCYGSNMDINRMIKRGVTPISAKSGLLSGYRLVFNKLGSKKDVVFANIQKDDSSYVEGVLYLITEDDLSKIDKREGYPDQYVKETVNVLCDDGLVWAVTYVANKFRIGTQFKPEKEYIQHLLEGKKYLSEHYYNKLVEIYERSV